MNDSCIRWLPMALNDTYQHTLRITIHGGGTHQISRYSTFGMKSAGGDMKGNAWKLTKKQQLHSRDGSFH